LYRCCIINGDYKQGGEIFGRLATCTNWSRAFYAYIHAACLYALGDTDRAKKVLATVPTLIRKRFGGRLIPAEQYVLRKHRQLTERSPPAHQPWPILILELVYIWNGFRQLDTKGREHVIRVLTECEKNARNADERAVALVALGCVLRENGQYASALQALNYIDEQIKDDRYAVVYSWYERSVIACYLPNDGSMTPKPGIPIGRWSEAESWLKRVTDASGYDFDNRIHLRAQLLSASIVEGRNAQTTS
jgi:tetratricopeptide (TPR) repeat protein